jgi:hypothetical protein
MKTFDELSDILKYECIEEVVCLLSGLDAKDVSWLSNTPEVTNTLSNYRISTYGGSAASRLNLQQNMVEFNSLRVKFDLFSVSEQLLPYCKSLRELFAHAPIQIVEKVGSANWRRYWRLKRMRQMQGENDVKAQDPVRLGGSFFHDSGLGSSLAVGSMQAAQLAPRVARSTATYPSHMSTRLNELSLQAMPKETESGDRICPFCEKSIKDVVTNGSQWRQVLQTFHTSVPNLIAGLMLSLTFARMSALLRAVMQTP